MITITEIDAWRVAQKITKKELAKKLGLSYSFLVDILNGKRELSEATVAKFERLRGDVQPVLCRFDDVCAYAVRLTPAEYRKMCAVAGVQDMTAPEVEAVLRDLLQRTWNDLAKNAPNVVEGSLDSADHADSSLVMPAPSVLPMPFPLAPAARGNSPGDMPRC